MFSVAGIYAFWGSERRVEDRRERGWCQVCLQFAACKLALTIPLPVVHCTANAQDTDIKDEEASGGIRGD